MQKVYENMFKMNVLLLLHLSIKDNAATSFSPWNSLFCFSPGRSSSVPSKVYLRVIFGLPCFLLPGGFFLKPFFFKESNGNFVTNECLLKKTKLKTGLNDPQNSHRCWVIWHTPLVTLYCLLILISSDLT